MTKRELIDAMQDMGDDCEVRLYNNGEPLGIAEDVEYEDGEIIIQVWSESHLTFRTK
jgi:hypothetical protein